MTILVRAFYEVDILDDSKTRTFESDVLLTPSFAIPSGILEVGQNDYFWAWILDIDSTEAGGIHRPVENRSSEYTPFQTAVPEPTTMLLLGSGLIGLEGYGKKKLFKK